MAINSKDFRVREGDEVNLRKWPTISKSERGAQARIAVFA
jgi:hypothetical protein